MQLHTYLDHLTRRHVTNYFIVWKVVDRFSIPLAVNNYWYSLNGLKAFISWQILSRFQIYKLLGLGA